MSHLDRFALKRSRYDRRPYSLRQRRKREYYALVAPRQIDPSFYETSKKVDAD